jgi:hypothetical protein
MEFVTNAGVRYINPSKMEMMKQVLFYEIMFV